MSSNVKQSETEKFIRETAMNAVDIMLNLKEEQPKEPIQKATVEDADESEKNDLDDQEDENTRFAKEKKLKKQSTTNSIEKKPLANNSSANSGSNTASSSSTTKKPVKVQTKKQKEKAEKLSKKMAKSIENAAYPHALQVIEEKKQKKLTPMEAIAMASEKPLSFLDDKTKKFYSERQREQPTSLERENYEKDNEMPRQTNEQYHKRNAIIKKIFLAHLIAFVNNERFFTYSQMFHKRQGRGCIYIQFSTLEDMAEHGEKVITGLEKEKVAYLNNHLIEKMIDLYDEKEEFVVCLNVTSIEECSGWFQTAIINVRTKTARIAETSTQPISFLPSYLQKIDDNTKAIEHNQTLFNEKETEIVKEEQKIRESLGKEFVEFLKKRDVLHFFAKKKPLSSKKSAEIEKKILEIKNTDPDADVDDKIKTTVGETSNDSEKNVSEQIQKNEWNINNVTLLVIGEYFQSLLDAKPDAKADSPEIIAEIAGYRKISDEIGRQKKQIAELETECIELLTENEEMQKQAASMEPFVEENLRRHQETEEKQKQECEALTRESRPEWNAKKLLLEACKHETKLVRMNRAFLIKVAREARSRFLYNCCNDPCANCEEKPQQFMEHVCKRCKFAIYCSQKCREEDAPRHSGRIECTHIANKYEKSEDQLVEERKVLAFQYGDTATIEYE